LSVVSQKQQYGQRGAGTTIQNRMVIWKIHKIPQKMPKKIRCFNGP
jgi:hypothetical protein